MRIIVPVALVIVVALAVFVQTRPDRFHIERSTTIEAPSAAIFPHINDFHRWTAWSPWERIDPVLQRSYDGPPSGLGAGYRWVGNNQVGEGSMRITESTPDRKVGIALEFIKPFKASNTATFTLVPDASGTRVTWAMDGQNTVVSKLMGLFMNMDRMIGGEFGKGLASLKGIAEGGATS
jgi:Polyketide cyclase / dehydrase and lipid transport